MCDTLSAETRLSCLSQPPSPRDCVEGLEYCINVAKYSASGETADTFVPGAKRWVVHDVADSPQFGQITMSQAEGN